MNETAAAPSSVDDLPTVEDYRVLSPSAVLTLVAGGASALALAHPLMLVVPLAALVLAAWSLRTIAAEKVAGRGLVIVGTCLAALFLGWSVGGRVIHQAILQERSREFVDDWLELVRQGDYYRAHQLHIAREHRLDPQANFRQNYETNTDAGESYLSFIEQPGFKKLRSAGAGARYRLERVVLVARRRLAEEVVLEYRVEGAEESFPIWITVRRTFQDPYRGPDWEIFDVSDHSPYLH